MRTARSIRFATFNASLYRNTAGQLLIDLSEKNHPQIKIVAEIIQRVNPDILILQEFDYDSKNQGLFYFQENYLTISHNGSIPVYYPYTYAVPSNTGIPSGLDLNGDGRTDSPQDAFGFGVFAGQYAFAVLSKYPLYYEEIRSFQHFLWRDMPEAKLPKNTDGAAYFSTEALDIFRLSSKNHVDISVELPTGVVHLLVAHPAPPIADGKEQRNRRRNHDEIRLWADYITGGDSAMYLYDDKAKIGGLAATEKFVILGDMNADPFTGNSFQRAIMQLLHHPRINPTTSLGIHVPKREYQAINNEITTPMVRGALSHTALWGLRVDYILPSRALWVQKTGLFFPPVDDPLHYLIKAQCSDHLLVWADIG
ncbi:endonuclease/exonuclease/phosphatase family protein [Beggiatoa leptomitoformis]|uniref:Endonuclease/exonuclease/phosphatase family protein n=1 Tax=Beggiatoa leptomitoformis TaxID=288004 RepID=A0A2N9YGH9_9GAMM|nr:endonuclease/exonuclease/phosphatase family protein [Beggiatoa leptomitoformis]ALG68197.1 endonuclease/exonuclease/phosphatase family protein [Beggiatoa leptomitoformis]AUI69499.1 endonuclease/exonuclease/phosphatase family protein [Beggiatoa leptomitoformis]